MPSPRECASLQNDLAELRTLKKEFDAAFDEAVKTGDLTRPKALRAELETKMKALHEKTNPFEKLLNLKEQYESQKAVLTSVGILEQLSSGLGIKGIDGKEYPFPSLQEVTNRLKENKALIQTKESQGFKKLLIVPFGMSLDVLLDKYKATILEAFSQTDPKKKLKAEKMNPSDPDEFLDLDTNQPCYVWDQYKNADATGSLVYRPSSFDKENHKGKTKTDLLTDPKEAWQILLVEDKPIPTKDVADETVNKRTRLKAGKTAEEYFNTLGKDQYQGESGMTPEDWLILAMTRLKQTGEVTDDYSGKGRISYLTGAYFPSADDVPRAHWARGVRQARLYGHDPRDPVGGVGVRPPVRV